MSQSEQQLTSEECEALTGFAEPTPRQVRRKAHERHAPWGAFSEVGGCFVIFLGLVGGIALFVPILRPNMLIALIIFSVLVAGFSLLLLPQGLEKVVYHKQLARQGSFAIASVSQIEIKEDMGSQGPVGWTDYTLTYSFQTARGETIVATRTSSHLDKFREGGPILIVYLPQNPRKHELFLLLAYEPIAP